MLQPHFHIFIFRSFFCLLLFCRLCLWWMLLLHNIIYVSFTLSHVSLPLMETTFENNENIVKCAYLCVCLSVTIFVCFCHSIIIVCRDDDDDDDDRKNNEKTILITIIIIAELLFLFNEIYSKCKRKMVVCDMFSILYAFGLMKNASKGIKSTKLYSTGYTQTV